MQQLLILLSLLLFSCSATAAPRKAMQQPYDVFYLAVGNSHYATDSSPYGFKNLNGANKSARKVAAYFDRAGAAAGITLVSEDGLVTRTDVLKALDDLLARVKRSQSRNPLVVFYFCGHGVSEGIGWNHFSIPGDFVLPTEKINIDTLTEAGIYAGEVSDAIEKQKLSCLLLLDSCYEGKEVNLPDTVISQQLAKNLTDAFKVLRYLNEFHGPAVAVFSTRPGTLAKMVQDPLDTDSQLSVGPLARRLMLSFEQAMEKKNALTIAQFLQQMSSSAFDSTTASIITLSTPEHPDMRLIRYPLSENRSGELRSGTGAVPKLISGTGNTSSPARPLTPPAEYHIIPETTLMIKGDPNEYVSGGKTIILSAQKASYEIEQDEPDHIGLSIKDGELSWDISFMPPAGKVLGVGLYKNAQRAGFQEGVHPGFEVSGDGRGCNEIEAQFTISALKRNQAGKLIELDADFWQRCDGAAAVLKGQLRFRATTGIRK